MGVSGSFGCSMPTCSWESALVRHGLWGKRRQAYMTCSNLPDIRGPLIAWAAEGAARLMVMVGDEELHRPALALVLVVEEHQEHGGVLLVEVRLLLLLAVGYGHSQLRHSLQDGVAERVEFDGLDGRRILCSHQLPEHLGDRGHDAVDPRCSHYRLAAQGACVEEQDACCQPAVEPRRCPRKPRRWQPCRWRRRRGWRHQRWCRRWCRRQIAIQRPGWLRLTALAGDGPGPAHRKLAFRCQVSASLVNPVQIRTHTRGLRRSRGIDQHMIARDQGGGR